MVRIYYRGAKAAIVCYDVTDQSSFNKAKYWIRELRSIEEKCKIYLCATKKDLLRLGHNATPSLETVDNYAAGIQSKFFVTSSKTGENIGNILFIYFKKYQPTNNTILLTLKQMKCLLKLEKTIYQILKINLKMDQLILFYLVKKMIHQDVVDH